MVKFSKQLEGQLVPEWKDVYCNYKELKKDVKRIKQGHLQLNVGSMIDPATDGTSDTALQRSMQEYTSLENNINGHFSHTSSSYNKKQLAGAADEHGSEVLETELMEPLGKAEPHRMFFNHLDAQLNKINRFYKLKETEYIAQARRLEKQLLALFEVQEALVARQTSLLSSQSSSNSTDSNSSSYCADESLGGKFYYCMHANVASSFEEEEDEEEEKFPESHPFHTVAAMGDYHSRLQRVGKSVPGDRICFSADRPSWSRSQHKIDLSKRKKKINSCEKMLCTAFIEFYRGLGLLKSYSSLNMVAFAKILKKYDKVTKRNLAPMYIKEVECSYFASSDKVTELMIKVEEIFTKHFSDNDRRKAMTLLRPMQQDGNHTTTFFLGIFAGWTVALLSVFLLIFLTQNNYRTTGGKGYMETVFRVFSTLGLVLLHMYMYGWNVYAWEKTRINYGFIFEFSPGTELHYREVLLICTALSSMLLGTMIVHIIASTKEAPNYHGSDWVPLSITLVFLVMLLIPVNIFYKSSRYFFLRCFRRIIFAPFYKVVLSDFFLGDQLTSQVVSFRNVQFMLCYFSGGYFQRRDESACSDNTMFKLLTYMFSLLPYWWRFLQCLRRWKDEGDKLSLYNAGKYMSAMVAVVLTLAYVSYDTSTLLVLFLLSSCCATLYQLYWDVVVDWGLLQQNSKNPWLRDNLILKRKYLYYISMWVNVLLRSLVWILLFLPLNVIPGFSQPAWEVIFAALEVIRRGLWNFYRLENEHLNNVGNFRAVKTVPLPFQEFEGGML
ncbi:unnamed protein product [Sphagnum jensenii]|uniref:Uncharacterized protein n=1 Tax=Sphagnum jensenii TaxID=128206 RepID=A0ABP0X9K6_9BRYO